MPTVLGHLDPTLATSGLAHGGWVLQRLGEPPLDEDHGTAALGLYDGDLLHLRPRDGLLPLVAFDDLVDGIHTGLSTKEDRWRPALTRRAWTAVTGLAAALAVLGAARADTGVAMGISGGVLALVLLAAGAAAARSLGNRTAALVFACASVAAAAVAGLGLPYGGHPVDRLLTGPGLLAGAAATTAAAVLARFVIGGKDAAFIALALAGALATAGGAVATGTGLGGTTAAAATLVLALLLVRVVPLAAARLAGLTVDPVPTSALEFQQDLDPRPSGTVLARAERVDAYLTALLAALGAVATACLVVLAASPRWDAKVLVGVVVALMLLHARELAAVWHRAAALVPAVGGLSALLVAAFGELDPAARPLLSGGLVVAAVLALVAAHTVPGRRFVPRWGRWGDLAHWACALAVLPLALSVAGAYTALVALWH